MLGRESAPRRCTLRPGFSVASSLVHGNCRYAGNWSIYRNIPATRICIHPFRYTVAIVRGKLRAGITYALHTFAAGKCGEAGRRASRDRADRVQETSFGRSYSNYKRPGAREPLMRAVRCESEMASQGRLIPREVAATPTVPRCPALLNMRIESQ